MMLSLRWKTVRNIKEFPVVYEIPEKEFNQ